MEVSTENSKIMTNSTNNISADISMNGQKLEEVTSFKYQRATLCKVRAPAEQVASLHGVAPRYLKLFTSSSFWPFMLISALMLFALLVVILLFSMPTSIPYAVALSTSLLVRS